MQLCGREASVHATLGCDCLGGWVGLSRGGGQGAGGTALALCSTSRGCMPPWGEGASYPQTWVLVLDTFGMEEAFQVHLHQFKTRKPQSGEFLQQRREANRRHQRQTIRYQGLVPAPPPPPPWPPPCRAITEGLMCMAATFCLPFHCFVFSQTYMCLVGFVRGGTSLLTPTFCRVRASNLKNHVPSKEAAMQRGLGGGGLWGECT